MRLPRRPSLVPVRPLASLAALALAAPLLGGVTPASAADSGGPVGAAASAKRASSAQIDYAQWDSGAQLRSGARAGTRVAKGRLTMSSPAGQRTMGGTRYDQSRWDSPWTPAGFSFDELIASWSAQTPGDTWVEIRVRGRDSAGRQSSWDTLARWTSGDANGERRTFSGQSDDLANVNVDTWRAPGGLASYQLRAVLLRKSGTRQSPSVDTLGAMTSRVPSSAPATSRPGPARGTVLDVPRYSQMIHRGHYPQWGNGGEAWCSPTSTSMVLGYYGALPAKGSYRWVGAGHTDPWVDFAARMTYDYAYDGAGNWPFNTAYAAPRAGKAFVTRLTTLRQAERFIKAGIPLVASVAFSAGQLSGAPISASNGHLMVISGFTSSGDVVVNDPAASSSSGVRRVYDRAQFERVWLNASGGLVYVIHDAAHPLPSPSPGNW